MNSDLPDIQAPADLILPEPIARLQLMPDEANTDVPFSQPARDVAAVETLPFGKRLIRLADLFKLLDVSKPTGHRLIAAGKIGPRAIRLTTACVRFDADEVSSWLSTRKPDGNLHDAKSWPVVWEALKRKSGL